MDSTDEALIKFYGEFLDLSKEKSYYVIEESVLRGLPYSSLTKIKGISNLRNHSVSLKYNKVSTKTDEYIFRYIQEKSNKKLEDS